MSRTDFNCHFFQFHFIWHNEFYRQVHAEVCGILLGSLEGLQSALTVCGSTGVLLTPEESSSNSIVGEVAQRIKDLSDLGKASFTK